MDTAVVNSIRLKVNLKKFTLETLFTLQDISFELCKGEGIALLGASGAGKTTLLKVIDGLYKSYEGEILLDGKEIKNLSPREIYSKMGLLFQNPEEQLFAETVFEDVAFGPRNMGFDEKKVKEAVSKALELVSLSGYENRSIQHLSFGEKKGLPLLAFLLWDTKFFFLMSQPLALIQSLKRIF